MRERLAKPVLLKSIQFNSKSFILSPLGMTLVALRTGRRMQLHLWHIFASTNIIYHMYVSEREREREILKVEINSRTESTTKLHHLDTCHSLANLLTSHYISLKHWGKRNCPHPVRRLHHHSGKPRLLRLSSEEEALQNHCSTIFFLIDPPHWKNLQVFNMQSAHLK